MTQCIPYSQAVDQDLGWSRGFNVASFAFKYSVSLKIQREIQFRRNVLCSDPGVLMGTSAWSLNLPERGS